MWWIASIVVAVVVVRLLWRVRTSPVQVLVNQALHMGWVAAGVDTRDGYKNTKLFRRGMVSVVWYRHENVELLSLPGPHRFKNFVELERWLTTPEAKLLQDFMEADAEAMRGGEANAGPIDPKARYFQEVTDTIHRMGNLGTLILYSQLNFAFMEASMELCNAGFDKEVPALNVAYLIAEGTDEFQSSPALGVAYLGVVRRDLDRYKDVKYPVPEHAANFLKKVKSYQSALRR